MEWLQEILPGILSSFWTYIAGIITASLFMMRKSIIHNLTSWITYILEGVFYYVGHLLKHEVAASFSLRKYCTTQMNYEKYKTLRIPSSRPVTVEIDRIFVSLNLDKPGSGAEHIPHSQLLSLGKRIRVMGDPGAGKSSLIKRLFRDTCYASISLPRKGLFPVLIELKNLRVPEELQCAEKLESNHDKKLGNWLYEHLLAEASTVEAYNVKECFESYVRNSGLLILLDGLDEVSSSDYQDVKVSINALSKKLSSLGRENIIILTMRTQFHQDIQADFYDEFPYELFIKRFSPSDIYDFLHRWDFKKDIEQSITRIYNDLTDKPTLREMCENPLILSMYVAEDQTSGYVAATDTRTEFYKKVTEELLIKRRQYQLDRALTSAAKIKEQRERIFGRIALNHLLSADEPANLLILSNALEIIKDILGCDDNEALQEFRHLATDTGLVSEERIGESFRFIHLTFCEFLAAYEVVQEGIRCWDNLIGTQEQFQDSLSNYSKSRLLEVIPFASGLMIRSYRDKVLNDVAELRDHRLLARCFLETKYYNHETWKDFSREFSKELMQTPSDAWNKEWLRDLYLFNVVVLDAKICSEHMNLLSNLINLEEFYESLAQTQQSEIGKVIESYAQSDAAAAFRLADVCRINIAVDFPRIVINHCDQAPFFALVRERSRIQDNDQPCWIILIAAAAVQSRVVADTLDNEPGSSDYARLSKNAVFWPNSLPSFWPRSYHIGMPKIAGFWARTRRSKKWARPMGCFGRPKTMRAYSIQCLQRTDGIRLSPVLKPY